MPWGKGKGSRYIVVCGTGEKSERKKFAANQSGKGAPGREGNIRVRCREWCESNPL
jgi:hypothetical protein